MRRLRQRSLRGTVDRRQTESRSMTSFTPASQRDKLLMLTAYKRWADALVFEALEAVPAEELLRVRATTFGNILMTLNHVHVVDDIFRHHLEGRSHPYTFRNTNAVPTLAELAIPVSETDAWYVAQVARWNEAERSELVAFEYIGGGAGLMSREDIILHLVNHTTYHRGFVGDMLKQVPHSWPANDLTVFVRDVWTSGGPA